MSKKDNKTDIKEDSSLSNYKMFTFAYKEEITHEFDKSLGSVYQDFLDDDNLKNIVVLLFRPSGEDYKYPMKFKISVYDLEKKQIINQLSIIIDDQDNNMLCYKLKNKIYISY